MNSNATVQRPDRRPPARPPVAPALHKHSLFFNKAARPPGGLTRRLTGTERCSRVGGGGGEEARGTEHACSSVAGGPACLSEPAPTAGPAAAIAKSPSRPVHQGADLLAISCSLGAPCPQTGPALWRESPSDLCSPPSGSSPPLPHPGHKAGTGLCAGHCTWTETQPPTLDIRGERYCRKAIIWPQTLNFSLASTQKEKGPSKCLRVVCSSEVQGGSKLQQASKE